MEALSFLIIVTAMAVFNAFLAYVLGWLFTEVVRHPLQFKPFNCRGCLTFWVNLLLGVLLAFVAAPLHPCNEYPDMRTTVLYGIVAVSVLTGLINFLYIKLKFRIL